MKIMNLNVLIGVFLMMGAQPLVHAQQPAEVMPLADEALVLSVTKVGTSLIMVGERGHVLKSKDDGQTWQQITNIPVNIALTNVRAATISGMRIDSS